jgi:hypothetical protein
MSKKFGKSKAEVEESEVEVEVVAEEVEDTPVVAKAKKAIATAEQVSDDEEAAPTKGAPRARKWNYGISTGGMIHRVAGVEGEPKGCQDAYEATVKPISVEKFSETVEDWRHCLRVMMRGKYVVIKSGNQVFPQPYDHEAAAAAKAERAAAKAAAKAEAEEGDEEDEAPAPAKKAVKK